MLWLKAFHVVFVVTWFAGIFYLPRLFVHHAECAHEPAVVARLRIMERRLLLMTHLGGALAIGFGLAILVAWARLAPAWLEQGWLHAKLALVALLVAYHASAAVFTRRLAEGPPPRSARWFRVYNELPVLLLVAIVVLVVVRPF
jgi:protoporphyrinogen IX oxidase